MSKTNKAPATTSDSKPQWTTPQPVLHVKNLHHELVNKKYLSMWGGKQAQEVPASDMYTVNVDELQLPRGEFVAILGSSGCGKTTLLTILGLARQPWRLTAGKPVEVFDIFEEKPGADTLIANNLVEIFENSDSKTIEDLRRRLLGFCLQSGELLSTLTVQQNVEMPMRLNQWSEEKIEARVKEVLSGLSGSQKTEAIDNAIDQAISRQLDGRKKAAKKNAAKKKTAAKKKAQSEEGPELWVRRKSLPGELSGGQAQRVALARAIGHKPEILFLDEPTGSLDPNKARSALDTLARLQSDEQVTVVMITHNPDLAHDFAGFMIHMYSPEEGRGGIERLQRKDPETGEWFDTTPDWLPVS